MKSLSIVEFFCEQNYFFSPKAIITKTIILLCKLFPAISIKGKRREMFDILKTFFTTHQSFQLPHLSLVK